MNVGASRKRTFQQVPVVKTASGKVRCSRPRDLHNYPTNRPGTSSTRDAPTSLVIPQPCVSTSNTAQTNEPLSVYIGMRCKYAGMRIAGCTARVMMRTCIRELVDKRSTFLCAQLSPNYVKEAVFGKLGSHDFFYECSGY